MADAHIEARSILLAAAAGCWMLDDAQLRNQKIPEEMRNLEFKH
jgi:hypothetical protein